MAKRLMQCQVTECHALHESTAEQKYSPEADTPLIANTVGGGNDSQHKGGTGSRHMAEREGLPDRVEAGLHSRPVEVDWLCS